MSQSKLHTKETPKVSHFTWFRGNSGKYTERMERTVMSIIWACYVVSAEGFGVDLQTLKLTRLEVGRKEEGRCVV